MNAIRFSNRYATGFTAGITWTVCGNRDDGRNSRGRQINVCWSQIAEDRIWNDTRSQTVVSKLSKYYIADKNVRTEYRVFLPAVICYQCKKSVIRVNYYHRTTSVRFRAVRTLGCLDAIYHGATVVIHVTDDVKIR